MPTDALRLPASRRRRSTNDQRPFTELPLPPSPTDITCTKDTLLSNPTCRRSSGMEEPTSSVWLGNLSPQVTRRHLYEIGIQAGPVVSVTLPQDTTVNKGTVNKVR